MHQTNAYEGHVMGIFDKCPKAVWAAIAVSYASTGGDHLDGVEGRILAEWWALYHNRIVPQKPPFAEECRVAVGFDTNDGADAEIETCGNQLPCMEHR